MKTYYYLMKPGIIMGNVITTAAGFALASGVNPFDFKLFIVTMIGLGLVIAAAGVFNNYTDRISDAKMERTKNRPLVTGKINAFRALSFGGVLAFFGLMILSIFTNFPTVLAALFGLFAYLVLYAIVKYQSFYGTLVGSLAGGVPPVVGYLAVKGQFDLGAFLIFMVLVVWQMPHFFAIALYRLEEYKMAKIPVLPVAKGLFETKIQMMLYILAFLATTLMLTVFGYLANTFAGIAIFLSLTWFVWAMKGMYNLPNQDRTWAYQMFVYSLVVMMTLCFAIPFTTVSVYS